MPLNTTVSIDWASYSNAVTSRLKINIANERGYRSEFVDQLHAAGYFGRCPEGDYAGWRAFPVHAPSGEVVAAHLVKRGAKVFRYDPAGTPAYPLVIGNLQDAEIVHVFESQWDTFAVMDRLEADPGNVDQGVAFVSTRGSSNVAGLERRFPGGATVLAWTQNDDPGSHWCQELETLCLRGGLRFGHLAPPEEYTDFNDLFRNDPDRQVYHRASLEEQVKRAAQDACATVTPDAPSNPGAGDEESDQSPAPFPLHALPMAAREIVEHGAAVMQVPQVLLAVCVLGALSAAVGSGIAVQSALGRKSYPNLYILAAAASGAGKTEAARLIYDVIYRLETELIDAHEQGVRPRALARKMTLTTKTKKLAKSPSKVTCEEEDDFSTPEVELAGVQAELKEVEADLIAPRLLVSDATTEVLGVLLAKYGMLASFSSDARDEISNVLGRYRDKGKTDEGLYIKLWSGDPHQVDRIGREPLRLIDARLSLLWLVQPDKLHEIVTAESLWEGGLLPRMLLVQTGARMQRIDPESTATIPTAVQEAWDGLVASILERYRQADVERDSVQPTPEAKRILAEVHNRGVDEIEGGAMHDMESFVARHAEQAWRVALLLHVADHPADAETHPLTEETASAAAEIVRWFSVQQKRLLAQGREDKRGRRLERLVQHLESAGEEETVRNLRDRHNWEERELRALVAAYPTKIALVTRRAGARGGRPSTVVKLL